MRLNELKEIAKKCGYEFKEKGDYFLKRKPNDIQISKKLERRIWINNRALCFEKDLELIKACIEFSETPLDEREDILDDEEHKYLSAVIRPFKNKVSHIKKSIDDKNNEYICIFFKSAEYPTFLPNFKANTMYKNMVLDEKYTLEELGL